MTILNKPFFILGNPRSGTSLLRIILNAHPNIVVPPESGFLQWWYGKYGNWQESDNDEKMDLFLFDLLSSKKIEGYNIDKSELASTITKLNPKNYSQLMACVYLNYGKNKNLKIWGDKNNYYIHHIPLIKQLYPKACFIHLIRDGRDVACSYLELEKDIEKDKLYKPNLPKEISAIAQEWSQNNLQIEKELKDTKHIRVKFEEIVMDFNNSISSILAFLQLPWQNSIFEYTSKNDEPSSTLIWKKKTKLAPQTEVVNRYKRDLSLIDLDLFYHVAGTTLERYEYSNSEK